jgi:O-succinylbenzoic acid--CoA ligase
VSSLRPVSGTADEITALLREWEAMRFPLPLVIATSGSTGRPKRVVLSRDAMRASAFATIARLGGPGTWELDLPPTYVAGVQVLFRNIVAPGPRRYLSLVPTQLVRRLEDPSLLDYDAVLVGGGPLDPHARAQAEATGIRVVQTYGMSETCGGCVYDGFPLDGVAVKIDVTGEVMLRGPMLFDGYEGDPELTAAVMDHGWLRTNDLGRLDEDGRLQILGRVDDVIISGGVKVPAYAVEQMLRAVPGVHDVAVVGRPDREWGEAVVAVLDRQVDLEELRAAVQPRTWAPKDVVVVPELPLLANGKVDRVRLRELVA